MLPPLFRRKGGGEREEEFTATPDVRAGAEARITRLDRQCAGGQGPYTAAARGEKRAGGPGPAVKQK